MTLIQIDLTEVRGKSTEFSNKANEVEAVVSRARAMMAELQGTFRGTRAGKIFSEWEGMQGGLTSAVNTLRAAGDLLKRATTDFESADSGL